MAENAFCNCATFADSAELMTGSSDYSVRSAVLTVALPVAYISLSNIMRIHTDEMVCIAASRAWSLAVSGSKDGSTGIWASPPCQMDLTYIHG